MSMMEGFAARLALLNAECAEMRVQLDALAELANATAMKLEALTAPTSRAAAPTVTGKTAAK